MAKCKHVVSMTLFADVSQIQVSLQRRCAFEQHNEV